MNSQCPLGFNRESHVAEAPSMIIIPSNTYGYGYDFDVDLSADIVSFLDTRLCDVSDEKQSTIKNIMTGKHSFDELSYPYVLDLFESDRSLRQRVRTACVNNLPAALVVSSALFVWAFNQPWAPEINIRELMHKWRIHVMDKECERSNSFVGMLYLEQMLPLAPFIPETFRTKVLMESLGAIQHKNNGQASRVHDELRARLLVLQGETAQACGTSPGIYKSGRSMLEHWTAMSRFVLNSYPDFNLFVMELLKTKIPRIVLGEIFKEGSAGIWSISEVAEMIKMVLPIDEMERFEILVWDGLNQDDTNQTLVRLYCPQMYPLIDLAATPKDWEMKGTISRIVDVLYKSEV